MHYTATIIEHMGGRGAGVAAAARDIHREWASNHHFELYDDVESTMADLAARDITLGVISNSHRRLDAFTEHFALQRYISVAISSAQHGYMKLPAGVDIISSLRELPPLLGRPEGRPLHKL